MRVPKVMLAWLVLPVMVACDRNRETEAKPPDSTSVVTYAVASTAIAQGIEASLADALDPAPSAKGALMLVHARLIDGTGAPPKQDVDVLAIDGVIKQVGPRLTPVDGARVIDLGGRTLVPGLIDAHVHLSFAPAKDYPTAVVEGVKSSEGDAALLGVDNARRTLRAGFTTVRVVGGGMSDRALRDAIRKGLIAGPRMLVANHAIGITGGHCDDTNEMHPDAFPSHAGIEYGVADSPDEVRKSVRFQIKHGADVIKLCATGGVMSQGDAVGVSQMTPEEMRTAVLTATRADRKVAAHAHGTEGIRDAVLAGVHSIEHGSILDRETARLMRERGTFLVPTVYVARAVEQQAAAGKLSASSAAKVAEITPKMRASFKIALEVGVRIAAGSDAGVFDHGENGRELTTMVDLGMKPMDAIVAATASAAELLGIDNVGTIAPGMLADFVVLDGDPLEDIKLVETPAMVIKGGVVHVGPTWGQ